MATKNTILGTVPKSRGRYTEGDTTTKWYYDNILEYKGSSFRCINDISTGITGAPATYNANTHTLVPNAGWEFFVDTTGVLDVEERLTENEKNLSELEKELHGKKDEDYKSGIKGSIRVTSEIGSKAIIEIVSDDIWFYNNIPILKGAHIVLKTQGGSTYRAYYLLGNNDILLETADPSLPGYRIYIIDVEENGKIITNCNPAGGSYSLTISYPQESLKDIVVSHNQKIEVLETDTSTLKESQESIEKIVIGNTNKDYTSELKAGSFKGYAIGSVHDCKVLPDTSANPWKYADIQTNEGDEFEFALRGGPTYPAVSILDKNNVVIDIEVMSSYTIIKKTMPTGAKRILINDDPSKGTASIIKLAKKGLKEEVEILNDKIEKIEEDSIVNHNKDIAHIIQSSSAFIGNQQEGTSGIKTQHKYLTILHGSDFHSDGIRFGRLVDMLNYYNIFDCAVLTGDFCKDSYVDNGFENTFVSHYQRANKPLLYSIGNHDVGVEKYVYSFRGKVNSIDNCNERFINPYTTYFGLTKGNGGYFYKDFEQFKIRVISINEYEMPRVIDTDTKYKYDLWYRYISQAQVNWFISALNIPNGWSVVIAMHQLPNALTVYDTKFKSSYNATSGDYKDSQDNLLVELIDAYISKVALNKTYVNTISAPSSDVPDVTVNVDFSKYNGTFICYLNGHTHGDMIGEVTSAENKQLNINITSGSCSYKSYYDDIMRVDGTKSQDCFNMIVFDTDKHKVRLLRIGANTTLNMTYRDMESISYV